MFLPGQLRNEREKFVALCANIDILITELDVCHVFELKGNLNDSTAWKAVESGDIDWCAVCFKVQASALRQIFFLQFIFFSECCFELDI